ncbi:serine hydrolase [soil metagenome]
MIRMALILVALSATCSYSAEPPTVTAKGWAILDGTTGKLVKGFHEDDPMKAASTTKIMCARVVLNLAAKDAKVLDEIVTFSKLADDTTGSTSGIKVGESLPVKELLYGLLLPSGNDAGNALSEHFNDRLDAPSDAILKQSGLDPAKVKTRINFLGEMNREAERLKLKTAIYRSTFGDGGAESDKTISPKDLAVLAFETMKDERFHKYVSTKEYETKVKIPVGGERTAKWKNTNRLLQKPGYDGVKTGTTNSAGSCLVTRGTQGKDTLIVVVLGSKADADRYSDSEALYKWAWEQRVGK